MANFLNICFALFGTEMYFEMRLPMCNKQRLKPTNSRFNCPLVPVVDPQRRLHLRSRRITCRLADATKATSFQAPSDSRALLVLRHHSYPPHTYASKEPLNATARTAVTCFPELYIPTHFLVPYSYISPKCKIAFVACSNKTKIAFKADSVFDRLVNECMLFAEKRKLYFHRHIRARNIGCQQTIAAK